MSGTTINDYEIPNWAAKAPAGFHLDVFKDEKMIQKLMIDEKKCYFFGRNRNMVDFAIDHNSCSRVHAALVWHKCLERFFIIDLGTAHGTFIGNVKIEAKKPVQLLTGSMIRFGVSTRRYVIRDAIQTNVIPKIGRLANEIMNDILNDGSVPEDDLGLDELTEFNTARNRCVPYTVDMQNVEKVESRKRKRTKSVHFNEKEIILNLEDVDPTVGRFRDLCQTTFVPKKKRLVEAPNEEQLNEFSSAADLKTNSMEISPMMKINSAPDVSDLTNINIYRRPPTYDTSADQQNKKLYAKESWPGRNPLADKL